MYGLNILYYIDIMEECKEIVNITQSESNVKKTLNDYILSKQDAPKTLHELEAEKLNANKRSVTILKHANEIYPLISGINEDTLQDAIQSALADAEKKTDEETKASELKNIAFQVNADAQVKATEIAKEVAQLNAVKLATAVELENANLKAIKAESARMKSEQVAINLQQILVTYNQNTEKKQNLQAEIDSLNKTLEKNKLAKVTAENELKGKIASFVECINTFNITEINAIPVDLYKNNIDHMRIIVDRLKQILEKTETVPLGRQSQSHPTSPKMQRGGALDEGKQTIEDILNTFTIILEKIVKDPNDAAELSIAVATAEALDKGENVDKAADDAFNKVRADAESLIDHIKTIDRKLTKSLKSLTKGPEVEPMVDTPIYIEEDSVIKSMEPQTYVEMYELHKSNESKVLKKETIQKYIQKFNDQYNQEYDTQSNQQTAFLSHPFINQIIKSNLYEIFYEQLTKANETNENLMNSIKQYSSMYYMLNTNNTGLPNPKYYYNTIKHMLWKTNYYTHWIEYFIRHISTQRGNFYFNIQHINTTEDKLEEIFSTTPNNIEFHLITSDEYKKNELSGFNNVIFSNDDSSINIKIEEPADQINRIHDRSNFQSSLMKMKCKVNTVKFASCEKDSGKCYKRCIFIKKDGTPVCTDPNKQIYFYIYSGKNNRIDIEKSVLVIQENNCKRVVKTTISIVKDVNRGGRSFMKKSKTTRNKITRLSRRKMGGSVRNKYRCNNAKSTINKNKRRN